MKHLHFVKSVKSPSYNKATEPSFIRPTVAFLGQAEHSRLKQTVGTRSKVMLAGKDVYFSVVNLFLPQELV